MSTTTCVVYSAERVKGKSCLWNDLLQDKDTFRQEILVAKEAMELAREKFGPMEEENKLLKTEVERHKEVVSSEI